MRINHNVSAMITQGAVFVVNRSLSQDMEKLSTGLRINRASDDAAGLSISEGLRAQIRGAEQAKRNTLDAISALTIAEGAANEIHAILQRMRELSIQSATATYSNTERNYMNQEFKQLTAEIERITNATNFNNIKLLTTSQGESIFAVYHTGDQTGDEVWVDANGVSGIDSITIKYKPFNIGAMYSSDGSVMYVFDERNIASATAAQAAITVLDHAIGFVSEMRADIGAYVNRLESTVNNLSVSINNQQSAESQIRDTDFANETSLFTRNQIIAQSSTAMLAQANQLPNLVLQLIQ